MPNVVTKIYSLGKEVLFIMKKRKVSKVIAVALAALMVIGMVPMMAFAEDDENFSFTTVDAAADESYTAETLNERDSLSNVVYAEGINSNTVQTFDITNGEYSILGTPTVKAGSAIGTTVFLYDGVNPMKVPVSHVLLTQRNTTTNRTREWIPTTEDFAIDGDYWYGYSVNASAPEYYAAAPVTDDEGNNANGLIYANSTANLDEVPEHTAYASVSEGSFSYSANSYINYSATLEYTGELEDDVEYETIPSIDWYYQTNNTYTGTETYDQCPIYVINVKPLYDAIVEAEELDTTDFSDAQKEALESALTAAKGLDLTDLDTYNYADEDGAEAAVEAAASAVAKTLKTLNLAITPCEHDKAKKVGAKDATCGADGNYAHVYCPDCETYWMQNDEDPDIYDMVEAKDVTIPATGDHRWGATTDYIAPTCEEDGAYATMTCKDCDNTYYYILGENEEYVEGETELILVVDDNYVIPSLGGHTFGEPVVKMEPNCTERGYQEYTCTVCGYTYGEEMKALGHTWDDGITTKAPTCEEAAEVLYTCTVCGETKTETTNSLGHDYDYEADTTYFTWSEDHESCTITAVCGNDSSHTETKDCEVTIEKTPATKEAEGSIVYTATYSYTTGTIPNRVTHTLTDEYTEVIPMFGDNAEMLDGGLVKVVEDENVSIRTNTEEQGSFAVNPSVSLTVEDAEMSIEVGDVDVPVTDDVDISFNYTGLNEDGTISVAEDATEVSFGIEDFTYSYSAVGTIDGDLFSSVVVDLIGSFGDLLGDVDLDEISGVIEQFASYFPDLPIELTSDEFNIAVVYNVYATDDEGNKYYFDVTYDEENSGNATFTCENIPAGDYTVTVEYTYDLSFDYVDTYTGIDYVFNYPSDNFLDKAVHDILEGIIDAAMGDGMYATLGDMHIMVNFDGTAVSRTVESSDEIGLALEKTIGAEDIIIEVEELEGGLLKTRTGADVTFVGGADDFVSFDVDAPIMNMFTVPFEGVTAADDLSISFNYSGLNETGTLTVAEDADVATFGIENFTYDYSAFATISSTEIVDVVVDLLGSFIDLSSFTTILYGMVSDAEIASESAALIATYNVYATAADGTVYPFSVVYDGNNATFTCYNIPAGEYDVTVEYAFDISFDYDTLYTGISDLLEMEFVQSLLGEYLGMLGGMDFDIPLSGTAEARVIESADVIPTTVLADIENEEVPSAGGESGSGESGESGSGESGESGEAAETCEHDFYIVDSQEATCEDEGWVLYACSICGEQFTQFTAALGHDFVNGVCTRCGALEEEPTTAASGSGSSTTTTEEEPGFTEVEETEDEDEFTEVEDEDEFTVVEDESSLSPQTGASLAAIGAAMAFAAAGIVVVTRKKKEED